MMPSMDHASGSVVASDREIARDSVVIGVALCAPLAAAR